MEKKPLVLRRLALALSLGGCLLLFPAQAQEESAPVSQPAVNASPTDPDAKPAAPQLETEFPDSRQAEPSEEHQVSARLQKRELIDPDALPVMQEIQKLRWNVSPGQSQSDSVKKTNLEKVFQETWDKNISVKQAETQVKVAEAQAKEIRIPNALSLLNPTDDYILNKAADSHIQAAKAQLQATRQKALLESARLHAGLVQAFLNKYLAFQAIVQGKEQLKAEQQRFIAGETNRFDVTQTQAALIDRYGKYLNTDNLYHTASMMLANQLGMPTHHTLLPEEILLKEGDASVPMLKLVPADLSLEQAVRAARIRPDLSELALKQAELTQLAKVTFGAERQKRDAELRQLALELKKATEAAAVLTEKAYADYKLSAKNLDLARQRFELASQFVHQLEVSHQAGFSSSKDVLDGQIELTKAQSALIGAQVAYNLSQIQLVYEMGLLDEDIFSHPLVIPNAL